MIERGRQKADDWQSRLDEAMEARGLSGGELARRIGFTAQYVNSLRSGDRGARLPLDTARRWTLLPGLTKMSDRACKMSDTACKTPVFPA